MTQHHHNVNVQHLWRAQQSVRSHDGSSLSNDNSHCRGVDKFSPCQHLDMLVDYITVFNEEGQTLLGALQPGDQVLWRYGNNLPNSSNMPCVLIAKDLMS